MSEPTVPARCPTCLSTDPKYKAYPVVEQCSHSNELHHCMFATCKDPFHPSVPAPPAAPASAEYEFHSECDDEPVKCPQCGSDQKRIRKPLYQGAGDRCYLRNYYDCRHPWHDRLLVYRKGVSDDAPASPSAEALPWYLDRKSSRYQRSNDAEREIASLRAECERLRQELDLARKSCSFCHQLQGHAADCWTVKQVEAREAAEKRCENKRCEYFAEGRLHQFNRMKTERPLDTIFWDPYEEQQIRADLQNIRCALNPPAQPTEDK